jgi:hypothetical protein
MAGILNSKERVMDFIITNFGKEKLNSGDLDISYATFTDMHTFYEGYENVAEDASNRIIFENFSRVQDVIVPPALPNGDILNFESGDIKLVGDKILSKNLQSVSGSSLFLNQYLSSSFNNFKENYILSEFDDIFETKDFSLSKERINFNINRIISSGITLENFLRYNISNSSTDLVPPILDARFSNITNYLYRLPIGLSNESNDYFTKNRFTSNLENKDYQNERIKSMIAGFTNTYGLNSTIDVVNENNSSYILQFFIQSEEKIKKLLILDLGYDPNTNESYYQVGKFVKTSEIGVESFVDSFILVLK